MITTAVLPAPTSAYEYDPSAPRMLARQVVLFAGMRGCLSRYFPCPDRLCVFEVAESGARYVVEIDLVRFQVRDSLGVYAPKPEES
jgi:hypothetical protein